MKRTKACIQSPPTLQLNIISNHIYDIVTPNKFFFISI